VRYLRGGDPFLLVEVNGENYRRNRKWLRSTPEESVETILQLTEPTELVESIPTNLS